MLLARHSNQWYDRLAELHEGYVYPWKSNVPSNNGEDTYLEIIKKHVSLETDVIDIGCGHGQIPIMLARFCKSIVGYDRVRKYIKIAEDSLKRTEIKNVKFICINSKIKEKNTLKVKMPAEDDSIDLFISRRGPTHWFPEVKRVAKEKAVLIQLNPLEGPIPEWNHQLPEVFRLDLKSKFPNHEWPDKIEKKLKDTGIKLDSYWIFDVPQIFDSIQEYYNFLSWGYLPHEIPSFADCQKTLTDVFSRYGDSAGLDVRFRRFLWKAEYTRM